MADDITLISTSLEPNSAVDGAPDAQVITPLAIPELLSSILRFSDKHTLTSAALVCKLWKEVALDWLWSEADVLSLVKTLGPLEVDARVWNFSQGLFNADWPNFLSYARRVRRLRQSAGGHVSSEAMTHIFTHLAANPEAMAAFLPKSQELHWVTPDVEPISHLLYFIRPTIRRLELRSWLSPSPLGRLLFSMAARPDIQLDSLALSWSLSDSSPVNAFLRSQPQLKELELKTKWDTLDDLHLTLPLLPNITKCVMQPLVCTQAGLKILSSIPKNWPGLRILHLTITLMVTPLMDAIRPLLSCPHLKILELSIVGVLHLDAEEVEEMGSAWPRLEKLVITKSQVPLDTQDVGLSISLLPTFVRSFGLSLRMLHVCCRWDSEVIVEQNGRSSTGLTLLQLSLPSIPGQRFEYLFKLVSFCSPPPTKLALVYRGPPNSLRAAEFDTMQTKLMRHRVMFVHNLSSK